MKRLICCLLGLFSSFQSQSDEYPEFYFSAFATLAGGKVLNGEGPTRENPDPIFLASYPNVSIYDEDFSLTPESRIGLQAIVDFNDIFSLTTQIVMHANDDFNPDIDWAYITYQATNKVKIQAGRKRLPLFYYSDNYDVGYSYLWIRPPADVYTWQIQHYNGANITYSSHINNKATFAVSLYAGNERDSDNKLLGEFFINAKTEENWEDILGISAQIANEFVDFRISHMTYTNERFITREGRTELNLIRDSSFLSGSLNLKYKNIELLTELGQMKLDPYKAETREENNIAMATLSYKIGDFTPYISYSEFKQNTGDEPPTLKGIIPSGLTDNGTIGEHHSTNSIGIRWDFSNYASYKIQFDKVSEKSTFNAVAGDSESITMAFDLIW